MEPENPKNKKAEKEEIKEAEDNTKTENEKELEIPKYDDFINLSYEEFGANCINCISKFFSTNLYLCSLKIYSKDKFNVEIKVKKKVADFERLYKLINSKYSKMNLQPFPTFLFTKTEEYVNYFDNLLNDIIKMAKENEEMKIIYLKFLYDFFIEDKTKEISGLKGEIISDMFTKENSEVLKTPKNSKFKISFTNIINSNKKPKDKDKEKDKKEKDLKKEQKNKEEKRKSKDEDLEFLNGLYIIENEWDNITIKITDENVFQGYIKIINQCLFISKANPEENIEDCFDYIIPLYNINIDIRKNKYGKDAKKSLIYTKRISSKEIYDLYYCDQSAMNMKLEEINTDIEITLNHNYSQYFINIFFGKENTINQLKNFVEFIENNSYILFLKDINPFPYIKQITEKYINIYGLLYLSIDSLQIPNISEECFIQILSYPYMFNTKKLVNTENNEDYIYKINQQFIIPIHNRFGKIKFQIYQDVFKGVLIKSKDHEVVYEACIEITQILNQFNNKEINFHLIFKSLEKESVKKKKNNLLNPIEEDGVNKKMKTNLLLTIKDYSSPFVLFENNKNKLILEDLEAEDDNIGVKIIFKRLRKTFYLFDELYLLYCSIYQFKYPIFSFLCMLFIFGHLYFIETKYIVKFLISILIIILISQSQVYKKYLESYVNKYVFSYKNPFDLKSKIISTKNELEDKELKNPDYLIEKEELNIINDILDPLANFSKYKLKYLGFLVKISKIIASVEKIKNLFLWTDPKLTVYFLFLLIMAYLFLFKIDFKYLIFISLAKKFFFGFFYYRSKYNNNKEVGRIILEHAVQNWREFNNRLENKFKRLENEKNIDLSTIRVYDKRFQDIIIDFFVKYSNAVISSTIFNIINSLKDMQNEIGKCEGVLKIKKSSPLYRYVKNNDKIYTKEVEIEDIFYYFIQNIKSDFYILRNKEDIKSYKNEIKNVNEDRYLSLSSENFVNKNNNENRDIKKDDKKDDKKEKEKEKEKEKNKK